MTTSYQRLLVTLILSFLILPGRAEAAEAKAPEGIQRKDGQLQVIQGGSSSPMTTDTTLSNSIKVSTNGTYTVGQGQPRELKEGQILMGDGMLRSPDGSIQLVLDHVTVKGGKVLVFKDGGSSPLTREVTLADGSRVRPDATLVTRDGRFSRLLDGQLVKLDGAAMPARDTVSLRKGKVVVQKDGSLINIAPQQTMVMNDGTRVAGDGTVTFRDGKTKRLSEGETLVVEGVVRRTN